jgi:Tol biopolymer transport system component
MKKFQIVILFVFLVGCSSSQNVPAVTAGVEQTQTLVPTPTAIPPTETLIPASTFTPSPTATAIGGGGGRIAFTSERDGYQEIYVINADGTNLVSLANDITPKFYPAWSPDGSKLAFGSNTNDSASIYIMNADGSNPTKLIDTIDIDMYDQATPDWRFVTGCCNAIWSPDGRKIAFSVVHYVGCCLSYSNIYVINADGSNLISISDHSALDGDPAWSPDSQKIAFDSAVEWDKVGFVSNSCGGRSGICVMTIDNTNSIKLTSIKEDGGNPSWSPDGKKIAFTTGWGGNAEVFMMNADGTDLVNLTHGGSPWDHEPIWSPDGNKIAFTSYRDGNNEIYVMNADGTDLVDLTNNPADDDGTVWSPDSTKIAFVSGRDRNSEIYVVDADGSNLVRLTNNPANDYSPVWSP